MLLSQQDKRASEGANSGPKAPVQKSWFQENSIARYTPFSVVPRTVKSFSNNDEEDEEEDDEYDDEDKHEEDDSDQENFVGTGSELLLIDSEEDKEARRNKAKKKSNNLNEKLDTQVKQLLNGLSATSGANVHGPRYDDSNNTEFGAQRFKSFNSRSRILDENAPPLVTLEDQYEKILRDSGNTNVPNAVEKAKHSSSDETNSKNWIQDLDKRIKYVNPDSFNAFNSNFFNTFSKNPVSRGNTISELTGINENNLDDSKNSFFDTYSTLAKRSKGDSIKSIKSSNNSSNDISKNEKSQNEYSILVYGYEEEDANLIIEHFNKFGKILENFEINNNNKMFNLNNNSKSLPINVGESWIKLTYNNETSFFRALNEDSALFKDKYYLQVIEFNSKSLFEIKSVAKNIKYANVVNLDDKAVSEQQEKMATSSIASNVGSNDRIDSIIKKNEHNMFGTSFNLFNAPNINKVNRTSTSNSLNNNPGNNNESTTGTRSSHRLSIIKDKKILKVKDKKRSKIKNRKIDNPLAIASKLNNSPTNKTDYNLNLLYRMLDWAFGLDSL